MSDRATRSDRGQRNDRERGGLVWNFMAESFEVSSLQRFDMKDSGKSQRGGK